MDQSHASLLCDFRGDDMWVSQGNTWFVLMGDKTECRVSTGSQGAGFISSPNDKIFMQLGDEDGVKGLFLSYRCSSACLEYQ